MNMTSPKGFVGFEDSVVISSGDSIIPCCCGLLQEEHPSYDCDWYVPDLRAAEEMYRDEVMWRIFYTDEDGKHRLRTPEVSDVARTIGVPVAQWEGRCHGIATLFVEHGDELGIPEGSRVVRGMWLGPISGRSKKFGDRANSMIPGTQHSWILCPDGSVVDPTRCFFEGLEPYVWSGFDDDGWYDEGANRFNAMIRGADVPPCPPLRDEILIQDPGPGFPRPFGDATELVDRLMGGALPEGLDFGRAIWLANLHYDAFEGQAATVFEAISAHDLDALIPFDNHERARQGR